jgi:hypothetical protein
MGLAGYNVSGRQLTLTVGLLAKTRPFVGDKPEKPTPIALPPQIYGAARHRPELLHAGVRRLRRARAAAAQGAAQAGQEGHPIEGVGSVNARFDKVIVYATENNRLAVGIDAEVEPIGERTGSASARPRGACG